MNQTFGGIPIYNYNFYIETQRYLFEKRYEICKTNILLNDTLFSEIYDKSYNDCKYICKTTTLKSETNYKIIYK